MIIALFTIALIIDLILSRMILNDVKTLKIFFNDEVDKMEREISELHEKIAKMPKCGRPKKTKL